MTAITKAFQAVKTDAGRGVVPYITAGFPNLAATEEIIVALGRAGATAVEVGVPFSDPMADGPTIQRACEHALGNGTTLEGVLAAVVSARRKTSVPVVLFSYLNPLLQFGLDRLSKAAADAGVSGVLVTDLPADLGSGFAATLRSNGLDFITLVAPTSTDPRLREITANASGFLYAVSRTGVTGTREQISNDARELVRRVRQVSKLPIALGFGISTVEHAREAWSYCDAVVIGSALVKVIGEAPRASEAARSERFIRQFTEVQAATAAER